MANIYEKVQKVRVDLQNTKLNKSGVNKYAGYNYFQLSDFIPTLNTLLLKEKLFTNFSIEDETATLEIINAEAPDEKVVFTSPIADANLKGCTPVQCLGGVHTYVKRYLYQNAFEIVEDDSVDGGTGKPEPQQAKPTQAPKPKNINDGAKLTNDQYNYLVQLNIPNDWLYNNFGVNDLQDLSEVNAEKLIQAYERKKKGNK